MPIIDIELGCELPAFVTVQHAHAADAETMAGEARLLTQVVARSLARATQCVHVQYAPPGAGRQAFGGEWVRSCPGAPAVDATREPINVPVAALNVQRSVLGYAVFDAALAPSPCSR